MKNHLILPLLVSSLLLAGCGPKDQAATTTAPASAVAAFEFTANDTMKYNLTRIEVKAGQEVKITLTNTGSMPKAAMAHNWVLLKKGTDGKAYTDAAVTAQATDYLPPALSDQVIAHTKMIGAKQSDEITFPAPTEPGEYPFVCTFPAHFMAGMHGVMVVK